MTEPHSFQRNLNVEKFALQMCVCVRGSRASPTLSPLILPVLLNPCPDTSSNRRSVVEITRHHEDLILTPTPKPQMSLVRISVWNQVSDRNSY